MDAKLILNFLKDLEAHNSFDWMKANKDYYEQAKEEFAFLIQELMSNVLKFDKTILVVPPNELMYKLNRDTRFSADKSPYNPAFRAHISRGGKLPVPVGYFLRIKPGQIFLGGGLFASMFKDATTMIRDYMIKNSNQFIEITEAETFKNNFIIEGEKLKNVPPGYDKDHKLAEYLKYKSWYIEYHVKDALFLKPEQFINTSAELFEYMKPFNDYLNYALKGFKMPERLN